MSRKKRPQDEAPHEDGPRPLPGPGPAAPHDDDAIDFDEAFQDEDDTGDDEDLDPDDFDEDLDFDEDDGDEDEAEDKDNEDDEDAGPREGLGAVALGESPPGFRAGFAAIVGRANVGKSTLLNQLVGSKIAIVSNVPQTTRHRILGVKTLPNGQIAFLDSPGFHKPQHALGEVMNEMARGVVGEAEVLLLVVDASAGFGPGDRYVLEQLDPKNDPRPVIAVLNKVDQVNKGKLLPLIEEAVNDWGCREAVPVSALSGDNCARLLSVVLSYLPLGPKLYPDEFVTDQDERRFVGEVIREKVLTGLRQEVPHSVAVAIDRMATREDGLLEIFASILVERESQKAIVIGARGARLKQVGTAAREELEKKLGRHLYLKLWVKVREDWRDKTSILRELGVWPG